MKVELAEKLRALSSVVQKLNEASDECSEIVSRVEDDLKRSNVGLTAWLDGVRIAESPWGFENPESVALGVQHRDYWELGYAKLSDGWHIAVRQIQECQVTDESREELTGPTALNKAPRLVRVKAVEHLERLVERLIECAQSYLHDVEAAKAFLREWDVCASTLAVSKVGEPGGQEKPARSKRGEA